MGCSCGSQSMQSQVKASQADARRQREAAAAAQQPTMTAAEAQKAIKATEQAMTNMMGATSSIKSNGSGEAKPEVTAIEIQMALEKLPTMPIDGVLETLTAYESAAEVQECGLRCLRLTASQPGGEADVITTNVMKPIVAAMKGHAEAAQQMHEDACWILGKVSEKNQHKQKLVSLGAPRIMIRTMNSFAMCIGIQVCSCKFLYNLAANSANYKSYVAAIGAIEAVLNGMANHIDDVEVQQHGCCALRILVPNLSNQGKIAELGGVEQILIAMETHLNVEGVQDNGCWALCNLANSHPNNQSKIASLGGLEAVMRAMEIHAQSTLISERGCKALSHIVNAHSTNKVKICAISGIDKVLQTMETHVSVPGVQEHGLWALRDFSADCPTNKERIQSLGGMNAIQRAMSIHHDQPIIQTAGREAMKHL